MREESVASVLIIDDTAVDDNQFFEVLQQRYRVLAAGSGDIVMKLVDAGPPSCALLNHPISGCDAFELVHALVERGVPVVMVAAEACEKVAVGALKRGAQDYLVKSEISGEQLIDVIQSAIEKAIEDRVLEDRRKQLESFAFLAGHDLRSPLQVVRLVSEMLQDRLADRISEDERTLFGTLDNGCRTMNELIEDLLDYSRIGAVAARKCLVDLRELLCQLIAEMETSFRAVGARVELGQLPTVFAVRSSMRQVFQNLLSNALKFRSSRPLVIEISAERQDADWWKICVADNGIGVAPENQSMIFEAFTRLHEDSEIEGSGIGLAAVKRAVELNGGRVWLESSVDSGASFYLTVPASC